MLFSLKLFGSPSLQGEQGVVGGRAVRGQRMALLALLAVANGYPITRDKLIALLWPDRDAEAARHHLSQTVYLLRQALGDDAVLAVGDGMRLNPERIRSDVHGFADFAMAQRDSRGEVGGAPTVEMARGEVRGLRRSAVMSGVGSLLTALVQSSNIYAPHFAPEFGTVFVAESDILLRGRIRRRSMICRYPPKESSRVCRGRKIDVMRKVVRITAS